MERAAANFRAHYVLMEAPPTWPGDVGFVTADIIRQHLPPPGDATWVIVCGPPPFCVAMTAHLDALGYTRGHDYYSYL